jgi:hypothetical protein
MYIFVDEPLAITGMHIEARPHRHIPSTQIHGQIHWRTPCSTQRMIKTIMINIDPSYVSDQILQTQICWFPHDFFLLKSRILDDEKPANRWAMFELLCH